MRFGEPQALLLLGLAPVAVLLFWYRATRVRSMLGRVGRRASSLLERESRVRRRFREALLVLALAFLALAAARPRWGIEEREVDLVGVDVLLALDTSFSMDARDVAPSRMERAKYIASELALRLAGNRLGLLVFSGDAFIQCPLTHDIGAVRTLLAGVATGVVDSPGTDLAAMLETAISAFDRQESRHPVVVLLTDGQQDTVRAAAAVEMAERAMERGITFLPIGVATPAGETIPVEGGDGSAIMLDTTGSPVVSRLDEATLRELARRTGGAWFRLSADDGEIAGVAAFVAGLEGRRLGDTLSRRMIERFPIPLGLGLLALGGYGAIRRSSRKAPAG